MMQEVHFPNTWFVISGSSNPENYVFNNIMTEV